MNARDTLNAAAPDLLKALFALVAFETKIAKQSFSHWDGKEFLWNDDIWRAADPEGFPLIEKARAAIAKASP